MKNGPHVKRGPGCKSKAYRQRHPYPPHYKFASTKRLVGADNPCRPANAPERQRGPRSDTYGPPGLGQTRKQLQGIEDAVRRTGRLSARSPSWGGLASINVTAISAHALLGVPE
jgi:hypothetical protein